jgi:hypothetical protein
VNSNRHSGVWCDWNGVMQVAYFADFSDGPYVVFWGNRDDMTQLRDLLAHFCATEDEHHFGGKQSDVILQSVPRSVGMQKLDDNRFVWRLDARHTAEFRDKVAALVEASIPCHQCLECDVEGEIAVLVSRDEYPPEMRP